MLSLLCAVVMVFYVPLPPGFENMSPFPLPYFDDYGDDDDQNLPVPEIDHEEWFEEQLEADLKWSFALNGYYVFYNFLVPASRLNFKMNYYFVRE